MTTPAELAAELGVSKDSILAWTRQGIITPEIREGRILRYDPEKVREQLAKRAAKKPKPFYTTTL